jgi:acetoin utilization protein AcuB
MQCNQLLSFLVPTLSLSDSGQHALDLMTEYHHAHLPLLQHNKFLGLVHENDILDWEDPDFKFSQIDATYKMCAVQATAPIQEAYKICTQFQLDLVPVVDDHNIYLGTLTQEILFNYLVEGSQSKEQGGIIVLEIEQQNYSLSQIARTFESENITILNVQAHTNIETNNLMVTIKCNKNNLQTVLPTFERLGYTITEVYGEQADYNNLKENFDSLMHYINI